MSRNLFIFGIKKAPQWLFHIKKINVSLSFICKINRKKKFSKRKIIFQKIWHDFLVKGDWSGFYKKINVVSSYKNQEFLCKNSLKRIHIFSDLIDLSFPKKWLSRFWTRMKWWDFDLILAVCCNQRDSKRFYGKMTNPCDL